MTGVAVNLTLTKSSTLKSSGTMAALHVPGNAAQPDFRWRFAFVRVFREHSGYGGLIRSGLCVRGSYSPAAPLR
jgi:hypothetical protein